MRNRGPKRRGKELQYCVPVVQQNLVLGRWISHNSHKYPGACQGIKRQHHIDIIKEGNRNKTLSKNFRSPKKNVGEWGGGSNQRAKGRR